MPKHNGGLSYGMTPLFFSHVGNHYYFFFLFFFFNLGGGGGEGGGGDYSLGNIEKGKYAMTLTLGFYAIMVAALVLFYVSADEVMK